MTLAEIEIACELNKSKGYSSLQEMLHAEHKARQAKYGFESLKLRQQQEFAARIKAKRQQELTARIKEKWEEQCEKPEISVEIGIAPKPRRNCKTKLTAESVAYIRANSGRLTGKQLATKLGVSQATISNIISGESWKEIVVENIEPPKRPRICSRKEAWEAILAVSEKHGVPVDSILGPSRIKNVTAARWEAIRAVASAVNWQPGSKNWNSGWTLARMERLFHRDHSTILHAMGRTARSRRLKRERDACYLPEGEQ